jgi:hypothetical protein
MLSTTALVSAEQRGGNKRLLGTTSDIVFKIYRDLMENYETASDILKVIIQRL